MMIILKTYLANALKSTTISDLLSWKFVFEEAERVASGPTSPENNIFKAVPIPMV
jgi:hypothetical protein